jgi:GNAT superfamily N-acetyltransferase
MAIDIIPFSEEHLDGAGALLAARHRAHRIYEPSLRERFEDPTQARAELERVWRTDKLDGVVAVRDGRPVGYLLGAPSSVPPTDFRAPFVRSGATDIPLVGHAVASGDGMALYQQLYAALATRWVANGHLAHYCTVPAHDRTVLDAWFALGFGQAVSLAVRRTDVVDNLSANLDIDVRRATPADETAVQELSIELFRTFADPPILMPFLPDALPDLCGHLRGYLDDPASPIWLAVRNGQIEALQLFFTPDAPGWFLSPMVTPKRSLYLLFACTAPDARSTGVNTALLSRTMEWASETGYTHCTLHYLTASRAAGYWRAQGFRPVQHWLVRQVDSRVIPT